MSLLAEFVNGVRRQALAHHGVVLPLEDVFREACQPAGQPLLAGDECYFSGPEYLERFARHVEGKCGWANVYFSGLIADRAVLWFVELPSVTSQLEFQAQFPAGAPGAPLFIGQVLSAESLRKQSALPIPGRFTRA